MIDFILATLILGISAFGGGQAAIALFQKIYIDDFDLITLQESNEIINYFIALPGPTMVNMVGYLGFQQYNILGMLIGITSVLLPTTILVIVAFNKLNKNSKNILINHIYNLIKPIVIALFILLVFRLSYSLMEINTLQQEILMSGVIFSSALVLYMRYQINPLILVIVGGFIGVYLF